MPAAASSSTSRRWNRSGAARSPSRFRNTTPLPAKIYANEGIAQILFFRADQVCEKSYADKKGKYQDQKGLTLPFVVGGQLPGK